MAAEPDYSLKACPDKPNCVSSLASDEAHKVAPYVYKGDMAAAKRQLLEILAGLKRVEIVKEAGTYIHITETSVVLRFVDDMEFLFDDEHKLIHVRSASRVGYSDFGVNRKRVERIRRLFQGAAE